MIVCKRNVGENHDNVDHKKIIRNNKRFAEPIFIYFICRLTL